MALVSKNDVKGKDPRSNIMSAHKRRDEKDQVSLLMDNWPE